MRRGWLAAALLVVMVLLSMWHLSTLDALTASLQADLTQAEALAGEGNWSGAEELTRSAQSRWQERDVYLRVTMDHGAVDQVSAAFAQTLACLAHREAGEYACANAALLARLTLLEEMERPALANLL